MKCDVCGTEKDITGVASSSVGPMSLCFCRECVRQRAEPEWAFEHLYSGVGNDGEGLAEWINELKTYKDGEYWTWDRWKEWRKNNPTIVASEQGMIVGEYGGQVIPEEQKEILLEILQMPGYRIVGKPLKDSGLDGLVLRYPNGGLEPLRGLLVMPGETVADALQRLCVEKGVVVFSGEGVYAGP